MTIKPFERIFPAKLLILSITTSVLAIFVISTLIYNRYSAVKSSQQSVLSWEVTRSKIIYFDEVLTSSAVLAAATGDKTWLLRHQTHEEKLKAMLDNARRNAYQGSLQLNIDAVIAANQQLLNYEHGAFELIRQNKLKAAQDLLASYQYSQYKRKYSDLMARILIDLQNKIDELVVAQQKWVMLSIVLTIVAFFLMLMLWVSLYRRIRNWKTKVANYVKELEIAQHDTLTGLPGLQLFNDRLAVLLSRAKRNQHSIALLYIDLDNFKQINDAHGHAAGDALMRTIAVNMKNNIRESDTISRVGGDEFVVLLENVTLQADAEIVAKKLLQVINEPILFDTKQLKVTASIGMATYPEQANDADALLSAADLAMYKAKLKGKNGFHNSYIP